MVGEFVGGEEGVEVEGLPVEAAFDDEDAAVGGIGRLLGGEVHGQMADFPAQHGGLPTAGVSQERDVFPGTTRQFPVDGAVRPEDVAGQVRDADDRPVAFRQQPREERQAVPAAVHDGHAAARRKLVGLLHGRFHQLRGAFFAFVEPGPDRDGRGVGPRDDGRRHEQMPHALAPRTAVASPFHALHPLAAEHLAEVRAVDGRGRFLFPVGLGVSRQPLLHGREKFERLEPPGEGFPLFFRGDPPLGRENAGENAHQGRTAFDEGREQRRRHPALGLAQGGEHLVGECFARDGQFVLE